MAWDRPTLTSLHERIARDFSGRLLDGATLLRRSVLAVLAKVWAGACHTLHSVLAWLYLQVFVDTAEGEYMERWAGPCAVNWKAIPMPSQPTITVWTSTRNSSRATCCSP